MCDRLASRHARGCDASVLAAAWRDAPSAHLVENRRLVSPIRIGAAVEEAREVIPLVLARLAVEIEDGGDVNRSACESACDRLRMNRRSGSLCTGPGCGRSAATMMVREQAGKHRSDHRSMNQGACCRSSTCSDLVESTGRLVELVVELNLPTDTVQVGDRAWCDVGRKVREEEAVPFVSGHSDESSAYGLGPEFYVGINDLAVELKHSSAMSISRSVPGVKVSETEPRTMTWTLGFQLSLSRIT